MKRTISFLLIAGLLLVFAACAKQKEPTYRGSHLILDPTTVPTTEASAATEPVSTTTATVPVQTTSPTEQTEATQATEPDNSYTVYIHRATFPVLDGPNADVIGTVGAVGNYTIVEEYYNEIRWLFGKLKSGGWIDLTTLQIEQECTDPIIIWECYKYNTLVKAVYSFVSSDDPYALNLEVTSLQTLTNVSVFSLDTSSGYVEGPVFWEMAHWGAGETLGLTLSFPDYSGTYGIRFTDTHGATLQYLFMPHDSGETTLFVVEPYIPSN